MNANTSLFLRIPCKSSEKIPLPGGCDGYMYEYPKYPETVGLSMNRKIVTWGASLLVLTFLLPVAFFLLSLIGLDLVEGLLLGLDWFCCIGWSLLFLIVGLFLLIIGLRTD